MIPEETALALTYNGGTHAVMMGTPQDLEDFAIGFSLNEGIIQSPDDIDSLDSSISTTASNCGCGWPNPKRIGLSERRRHIAGPTGCGICGIDILAEAVRRPRRRTGRIASRRNRSRGDPELPPLQAINVATRAVHAAAFWTKADGLVALREDVGRHNALDKLAGALAQQKVAAGDGMVLLTSRVSVEMVQKTARWARR